MICGQQWNGALALRREQALRPAAVTPQRLDPRQQRAGAGIFQALDDQLIFGAFRIGGDLAGGDDLDAVFRLQPDAAGDAAPDDRADLGALVLQREIDMAGGIGPHFGDLAAHPDPAEGAFQRLLDRPRKVGDAEFRRISQIAHRCRLC